MPLLLKATLGPGLILKTPHVCLTLIHTPLQLPKQEHQKQERTQKSSGTECPGQIGSWGWGEGLSVFGGPLHPQSICPRDGKILGLWNSGF